jgi:hypothetical protein
MATFRNSGSESIAFRDDAGKHIVDAGETFTVIGDQHVPHVETLTVRAVEQPEPLPADATVEELRERARELGIPLPSGARKADIEAALRDAVPTTIAAPEVETIP